MRALRYSIVPVLLGLLAMPQAEARGGGGGGGGGFVAAHGGAPVAALRTSNGVIVGRRGFVRHQSLAPFTARGFSRRFARNGFQNGFPAWADGWGWPIGDWWPGGYGYQPDQPAPEPRVQPQVIVIRADGDGHMQTTQAAAPDYGYIEGCHAIPNGYHCNTSTH
jgi:hypothetical protein